MKDLLKDEWEAHKANGKINEPITVDPDKIYYVEYIKDCNSGEKGELTQVIGTYFMELMLNEYVKEILLLLQLLSASFSSAVNGLASLGTDLTSPVS